MLQIGKIFCNHIEIVYVTCPNILKMDVWTGAIKHLDTALTG